MNKQNLIFSTLVALSLLTASKIQAEPTTAETRTIAKEAFTWGFPAVSSYKTLYAQAVDKGGKDYKAPFNKISNTANVFTSDDRAIVTPNSDTPYSFLWADLRAEPLVLTVPKIEAGRYYSLQFIDLFTQNFAYAGTRAKGNGGGKYLLVGPNWKGEKPAGIDDVFRSESEISYVLYRTQLFGPDDLANVKAIQQGYKVESLSAFLGKPAPKAAPTIKWPKPDPKMEEQAVAFDYLNFLLQFAPVEPSEATLRKKFEQIGIAPGKPFNFNKLPAEKKSVLQAGVDDAWKTFADFKKNKLDTREINSGDMFGSREFLKNNYLYRFSAAKLGIYGNSREEALYPAYFVDADSKPLNAATNNYVLNFTKENMPPALAFWSVTMYDGKSQLLVANPLKRYLINSPMLSQFKKDADGKFTIYVQKTSPGPDKESNWLPAPDGPFYLILRLYQPKPSAFDGSWHRPELLPIKR